MSSSALNSHADLFVVNVSLGAQPDSGFLRDFSSILVVDKLANSTLNGRSDAVGIGDHSTKYITFSETEVDTLTTANTDFGVAAKRILKTIFAAKQHPSTVTFLAVDFAGTDTLAEQPANLLAAGKDYYWVVPTTTDEADPNDQFDIPLVVSAFSTSAIIMAGLSTQPSVDADINDIVALSTGQKERLYLTYNSNTASSDLSVGADFAEICAIYASVDYDNFAPSGNLSLTATSATTITSATAKTFMRNNNINFAGPISGAASYVDAGVMFNGRPIYQVIFGDVIENRVQVDIMRVKADLSARVPPEKLPMNRTGQALVLARLDGRMQSYQRAGHTLTAEEADARGLVPPHVKAKTITADDIAARQLVFNILQYHLDDARKITVNVNVV